MENVTWAVVGVTCQQQFSYNLIFFYFGNVNAIDVDSIRIQCTLGVCEFNSHSNRIKCEKAFSAQVHVCWDFHTSVSSKYKFCKIIFGTVVITQVSVPACSCVCLIQ